MLEHAAIIALLVLSVWYVYQEGEIFGGLGRWFEKHTPEVIHQPLFSCNVCMCFWYGSVLYWLIYGNNLIEWLIVVIVAMGINVVINKLSPDKEAPNLTDRVEEIESVLQANGLEGPR